MHTHDGRTITLTREALHPQDWDGFAVKKRWRRPPIGLVHSKRPSVAGFERPLTPRDDALALR